MRVHELRLVVGLEMRLAPAFHGTTLRPDATAIVVQSYGNSCGLRHLQGGGPQHDEQRRHDLSVPRAPRLLALSKFILKEAAVQPYFLGWVPILRTGNLRFIIDVDQSKRDSRDI